MGYLKNHKDRLLGSDWLGLPEITNNDGDTCHFSCDSQAWSIACLVEGVCYTPTKGTGLFNCDEEDEDDD